MKYRPMYKHQLAQAAGVSVRTLYNWLQTDKEAFQAMHISPKKHLLPARAVQYLDEKYCIF
ncbi:MAG: hypothetical protein MJZ48_02745 [Paludibacteraceae bacterium]|nr:hypothetical protein [Paludibacteraceae bacterium]